MVEDDMAWHRMLGTHATQGVGCASRFVAYRTLVSTSWRPRARGAACTASCILVACWFVCMTRRTRYRYDLGASKDELSGAGLPAAAAAANTGAAGSNECMGVDSLVQGLVPHTARQKPPAGGGLEGMGQQSPPPLARLRLRFWAFGSRK